MGKKLIITEKPSVARDFARVLAVNGNKNGYIENDEYVISWCYGHLVEMAYPESYDEKYKTWRLEDLPFLPKDYKYGVVESAKDQYVIVNKLLHRDDIDVVYWAGDSGKEGQTIEENIRNYGGVRNGMEELRVWIDSQTDDEIKRGIKEARPMSEYARLGKSGIMRTIEDYSLGINFSRALSVKYGRMINDAAATSSYTAIAIGRVMTCVLGMVVNREREIRDFVETPFFKVVGHFSDLSFPGEWKVTENSKYINSPLLYKENGFKKKESAEQFIAECDGKSALIENIESNISKKKAPLLFNLAELQSECSKIFKISPAQTLDVVQELYEKKFTTYPRTDARVLTTAVAKEISKNLRGLLYVDSVSSFVKEILDNKRYVGLEKTSYTDDKKVTDHYAIIPTGQTGGLDRLSPLSKSVYELIVKRFVSIFYPAAEYKNVKLEIKVGNESFFSSAKLLIKPGYLAVSGMNSNKESDDENDSESFSKEEFIKLADSLAKGDELGVSDFEIKEGKTSPPKRYTSGNLILAMENAGNLIEDEELREQIKKSGIGTSATRGEILDKLVRIKYLNQNNKTQIITPENLGEMIYEVVKLSAPSLLNPEMTANWEMGLEGIVNGTVDDVEYRNKLEDYIRRETTKMITYDLTSQIASNINQFTGKDSKGIATRKALGVNCPSCGGELTTTSFGYGCSNYFNKDIKCMFNVGQIAGVDLEENEFLKLINEGKTDVISGFLTKSKKPFKAALKLTKSEDGKFNISFDFSDVPLEKIEDCKCPVCGNGLIKTGYGYSCEKRGNNDTDCYFSIGEIAGKSIDLLQLKKLISEGRTDVIEGFKSKQNKPFKARLLLRDDENNRKTVIFDFDGIEPDSIDGVKCPDCGGKIYIKGTGFSCSNYNPSDENSCRFYIGEIAHKNLSVANVKELLTDGKTKTIRGFKGKSGKKFDACLILKKNESGKHEISFDFDGVEAKVVKDVKCPVCGGEIIKTSFGYGCKNYDRSNESESCRFNIGSIAGVKLNESLVKELLQNGITSTIDGFKSKSGSKFSAKLSLEKPEDEKNALIRFVFEDPDVVLDDLLCPKCQGKIIKGRFGYRCENNTGAGSECSFRVGNIAGRSLSIEEFTSLLTKEKTDVLEGFTSKAGNSFSAALKLDENKNVIFIFD